MTKKSLFAAYLVKQMKPTSILLVLIGLIFSCNITPQEDTTLDDSEEKSEMNFESSVVYNPSDAIWHQHYDQQTQEFVMEQIRPVNNDTLSGEILEKIINKSWPSVQIKFIRISNDTAFISIPDSEVLTQQMGTAGAENFMVSTTYTFTELKGIKYVSFDFKEGDHAIPGVYKRNS
jgi:hypothetical protein